MENITPRLWIVATTTKAFPPPPQGTCFVRNFLFISQFTFPILDPLIDSSPDSSPSHACMYNRNPACPLFHCHHHWLPQSVISPVPTCYCFNPAIGVSFILGLLPRSYPRLHCPVKPMIQDGPPCPSHPKCFDRQFRLILGFYFLLVGASAIGSAPRSLWLYTTQ